MPQLSHRTGSFNNLEASLDVHKNTKYPLVRRCASSGNQKIGPLVRPATPVAYRSSEAHIQRIRSATLRGNFKQSIQVLSLSANVPQPVPEKNEDRESDDDISVDSVDITAYLYKPEYIINPSSKSSPSREDIPSGSASTDPKTEPIDSSPSVLKLPTIFEEKVDKKDDFVESYVRKSIRRDKKGQFRRDINDYTAFIKNLQDEIREMSEETKRLEAQPFSRNRNQESREEIVHRGYVTLKRMYELNPELTESAAKKNICGPPGKHWMGMSRVEVLEIMRRIRKELGVPPAQYGDDSPRMSFSMRNDKKSKKKGARKSRKLKKSSATKERKTKQTVQRLKTPIVPLQHVPGPKYLHTNVCIRPWEATLDGWNHSKEENEEPPQEAVSQTDYDNPPNSPRKGSGKIPPQNDGTDTLSMPNAEDEDFLTLEIFNPIFKLSR